MNFLWRRAAFVLSVIMAASVLGIGSALYAVRTVSDVESHHVGPWRAGPYEGEGEDTPWLRTARAMTGLFAPPVEQALQFTAFTDSAGERLTGDCSYRVTGPPPDGQWWSLTLYGRGQFLRPEADGHWSVDAGDARAAADGRIAIDVDAAGDAPGGISTAGAGNGFSLTLRVYGPGGAAQAHPEEMRLFVIERGACR